MNKFVKFLLVASIGMVGAISPTLGQGRGPSMMDEGGMMNQDGQGQRMMRRGMKAEEGKTDGQGMMSCPMIGGMMGGKGGGRGMMHSRAMMEARLAYIKTDLEITETQTEAWDAYADAVRTRQAAMKDVHADMMKVMKGGTALERMDARIKATETKLDNLKALKPAIEGLYAVLTDSQKKKADKLLVGGCSMM